ncbi:hypothetical protein VSX64_15955 [Aurantimonas sp. C2-6-R+9]|nr:MULTISPECIES: hypothetical protein [unclassified Aurantimonas]MEC5292190.1 hypothetical protein [Aurantimonas sp. C2-3-R2]MEC5382361.1 hypothetical protein [Aurantimonas sp. C2-6-R+9]MEC5413312.1 hypothetical protein [Aurantimonas sp. C2-4-R8]
MFKPTTISTKDRRCRGDRARHWRAKSDLRVARYGTVDALNVVRGQVSIA